MQDKIPDQENVPAEEPEMTEAWAQRMHEDGTTIYTHTVDNFTKFNEFCMGINTAAITLIILGMERFKENIPVLLFFFFFCLYAIHLCSLWRKGMRDAGREAAWARSAIKRLEPGREKPLFPVRRRTGEEGIAAFMLFLKVIRAFRALWLTTALYIFTLPPIKQSFMGFLAGTIVSWYDWFQKFITNL